MSNIKRDRFGGPFWNQGIMVAAAGGHVDMCGHQIGDGRLLRTIHAISQYFGKKVIIKAGTRVFGVGKYSKPHMVGRAADLWIDGETRGDHVMHLLKSNAIIPNTDYTVIYHGRGTCPNGKHIHLSRNGDNRPTQWIMEQSGGQDSCYYSCR